MFLSHFPFLFSRCFCIFAFLVARMQTIYAICHCTFFAHHPPTKRKPSTKERERVLWAREREPDSQPKDFSLAEWLKKQKSLNKIKSNNMHGARKARMPCHSSSTASQFATPPSSRKNSNIPPEVSCPHTNTQKHAHTISHAYTLTNRSASYRKTWQKVEATHLTPPIFAFFRWGNFLSFFKLHLLAALPLAAASVHCEQQKKQEKPGSSRSCSSGSIKQQKLAKRGKKG